MAFPLLIHPIHSIVDCRVNGTYQYAYQFIQIFKLPHNSGYITDRLTRFLIRRNLKLEVGSLGGYNTLPSGVLAMTLSTSKRT